MNEFRSLPHRVSLGVIRGGCGGGGGGFGPKFVGFSATHLELGKTPLPKGLVLGQISVLLGKWLFRRPKEKQASSDAADAGLGVSADAADAGRIVATLSSILALGVLQHVCLCLAIKTCFSPVAGFVWQGVHMLEQNSSY